MAATILVQPEKTYHHHPDFPITNGNGKRKSPNFGDVSHSSNIGRYRVVSEKKYDVRNNDWKFPADCKYTITSAPMSGSFDTNGVYTEAPKYFELDPKAVPSCNGFYSPSRAAQQSPRRDVKIVDSKSLHRPNKDKAKQMRNTSKQKKMSRQGTM